MSTMRMIVILFAKFICTLQTHRCELIIPGCYNPAAEQLACFMPRGLRCNLDNGINIRGFAIRTAGKENAVVLGRSNIVGKPQALLLLRENATVTVCHSKTRDLPGICRKADILVSAMGRAKMIDETYVNPEQIVVDVAINSDENGKLCGDVDYEKVADKVAAITPVPGGGGPMTIAMLLKNTLKAYRRHMKLDQ